MQQKARPHCRQRSGLPAFDRGASTAGTSLPAGLKIATFDDYPWNHVLFGGVTTAAQDTLTIAERVVERLSERIDVVTTTVGEAAKLAPKRIEIPGHIEHRASTSR